METAFTSENVWAQARNILDERALRLLAACFARALGHGGVQKMARLSGLSRRTLSTARRELAALPAKPAGRPSGVGVRRKGSGPKTDPELRAAQKAALNELIEPHVRGDPMSPLRWTTKSLRKLSEEMAAKGFAVSHETVRTLLLEEGYTMQSCKRSHEGGDEPQTSKTPHSPCSHLQRRGILPVGESAAEGRAASCHLSLFSCLSRRALRHPAASRRMGSGRDAGGMREGRKRSSSVSLDLWKDE